MSDAGRKAPRSSSNRPLCTGNGPILHPENDTANSEPLTVPPDHRSRLCSLGKRSCRIRASRSSKRCDTSMQGEASRHSSWSYSLIYPCSYTRSAHICTHTHSAHKHGRACTHSPRTCLCVCLYMYTDAGPCGVCMHVHACTHDIAHQRASFLRVHRHSLKLIYTCSPMCGLPHTCDTHMLIHTYMLMVHIHSRIHAISMCTHTSFLKSKPSSYRLWPGGLKAATPLVPPWIESVRELRSWGCFGVQESQAAPVGLRDASVLASWQRGLGAPGPSHLAW